MNNKRELTQQYKRTLPAMGVYVIHNLVDQRVFLAPA